MLDKLNPRERKLVILILVLGPLLLLPLGGLMLWNSLDAKRKQIIALEKVKSDLELNRMRWVKAEQRRTELRKFSLPTDPTVARTAYKDWLQETSNKAFGEGNATVKHQNDVARKHKEFDVYWRSDFNVSTRATLDQLMNFLDSFEQLDCLHRIDRLTIQPIVDIQKQEPTKLLTLKIDISAIAVAGADVRENLRAPVETAEIDLVGVDAETRQAWRDRILRRNVFGLPNNAPQLTRAGTRRFKIGDRMELPITARDADEADKLTFELIDPPMTGVTLEPDTRGNSARLVLPGDLAVGSYTFTVAVSDDGLPPKSDRHEFSVEVEEAPTPEPEREPEAPFDPSVATFVTGVVKDRDGVRQVFIDIKPLGETLRLGEGETFEVGTVKGRVVSLENGRAVLEIDGEERTFRPGQPLIDSRRAPSSSSDDSNSGPSRSSNRRR